MNEEYERNLEAARAGLPVRWWGHEFTAAPGQPWYWADPCRRCELTEIHEKHHHGNLWVCCGRAVPWLHDREVGRCA